MGMSRSRRVLHLSLGRGPNLRFGVRGRGRRPARERGCLPLTRNRDAVSTSPEGEAGALRRVLPAPLILLLAACGFSPLYATDADGIRSEMRGVVVGSVTGPPDAAYYTEDALRDALPGGADTARYTLEIALRDARQAVAVTRQANTTRFDYLLNARYTLRDLETGEARQNTIRTTVSYGVVESQYASLVGREDAVRRAALDLARRVETDVALYLKGRAPETARVPLPDVLEGGGDERGLGDFDGDDFDGDDDGTPGIGAPADAEATDAPAPTGG